MSGIEGHSGLLDPVSVFQKDIIGQAGIATAESFKAQLALFLTLALAGLLVSSP